MKVGFIGAGKVGCSFGKYFMEAGEQVVGYYSRSLKSAVEAADFTQTKPFQQLDTLIEESELVFLTVPDQEIVPVWELLKRMDLKEKIICHCSGSFTSKIFNDIEKTGAYGFSIHPILAISDRYQSYQELSKALFTLEGNNEKKEYLLEFFTRHSLTVQPLDAQHKVRYHSAAVFCSNLMVALWEAAEEEYKACGFSTEMRKKAMEPLIYGNLAHLSEAGPVEALTGPVERGDVLTVKKHMGVLQDNHLEIYRCLSKELVAIAKEKHPDRDYTELENVLNTDWRK